VLCWDKSGGFRDRTTAVLAAVMVERGHRQRAVPRPLTVTERSGPLTGFPSFSSTHDRPSSPRATTRSGAALPRVRRAPEPGAETRTLVDVTRDRAVSVEADSGA